MSESGRIRKTDPEVGDVVRADVVGGVASVRVVEEVSDHRDPDV